MFISGGYQKDSEEIKPTKPKGLRVNTDNFHRWAFHFLRANGIDLFGKTIQTDGQITIIESLKTKYRPLGSNITNKKPEFFLEEISWIKGKVFQSKEEYLDAKRTGRGTADRVNKSDKEIIWKIYSDYTATLKSRNLVDFDDYALLTLNVINSKPNFQPPFTHIIVDEAQDLSKAQIMVISKIVSDATKSISIIADAAQRIYKSGFTWSEVGINVRGARTIEFKKNYRNTVHIAKAALSLLDKENDKSEFTTVETARKGEHKPVVGYFNNWNDQCSFLYGELSNLIRTNHINSTVVLHRNHAGMRNIKAFLESKGLHVAELRNSDDIDFESNAIHLCTLSSIKGLEFDNVFIIDLNDDIIPYPPGFNDDQDEFHISTERRLLYTAMTRTREKLYLLSSGTPSRYLSEIDENLVEKRGIQRTAVKPIVNDVADDLPF